MGVSKFFGVHGAQGGGHHGLAVLGTHRFWLSTITVVSALVWVGAAVPTGHPITSSAVAPDTVDRAAIDRAVAADLHDESALNTQLTAASALYTKSAGQVADETTRASLQSAVAATNGMRGKVSTTTFLQELSQTVMPTTVAGYVSQATSSLGVAIAAVQESEQKLAAQKAAAAAAAAAAARAAAASARAHSSSRTAPSGAPGTVYVWTSGFQVQINACRGAVDVTAQYGVRAIAEHWSCGGRSFPTTPGSTVTVTGLDAGTYRVLGVVAVLNVSTATTADLPRGYQLLFQTCRGGNSSTMEFVALEAG